MREAVYKYNLTEAFKAGGKIELSLPINSKTLAVQVQRDKPCLWVAVDVDEEKFEARRFVFVGTGYKGFSIKERKYIGTIQLQGGSLVFHLFEE